MPVQRFLQFFYQNKLPWIFSWFFRKGTDSFQQPALLRGYKVKWWAKYSDDRKRQNNAIALSATADSQQTEFSKNKAKIQNALLSTSSPAELKKKLIDALSSVSSEDDDPAKGDASDPFYDYDNDPFGGPCAQSP